MFLLEVIMSKLFSLLIVCWSIFHEYNIIICDHNVNIIVAKFRDIGL